ncbi:sortilin-related receptor-like, partial [Oppia nitens]|uniref:sortilin-related receptor-like n=1 Tax=Oppia nitens TaxID=1686743 RepID=UPI0023DB0A30
FSQIILHSKNVSAVNYWRKLGPIPSDLRVNSECKSSLQCLLFIPNSHCDWDQRVCTCQPYYILYNDTTCLPASLLGFGCSIDAQCTLKVPNSQCLDGICQCKQDFIPLRRDKCLPPAKVEDYCLNDQQCRLYDRYTHCKYIIPRIYGKCKCPLGNTLTKDGKCLPNLQTQCYADNDCQMATNDSVCKLNANTLSSEDKSCVCRDGFEMTDDKLHCRALPTTTKPSVAPINAIDSDVDESAFTIDPVSLGKQCKSSVECQIRDPFSACIGGICECISKTPSCSVANRGCHNDTFQCRNGQCISWYFVCDKNKNCDDGSDEEGCVKHNCPKEAFQCNDGTCLSRGSVCNGKWECPDGSDEARCYKGIPCDYKAFRCKSGQCLPQYTFCNAVADCLDGSDENEEICEKSKTCPNGTFQCENNRCRSTAVLCSGVDGCGDDSDENKCEVCYCEKPMRRNYKRFKFQY